MAVELVQIALAKIMQSPSYTLFILGNEEKKFAIYTEPHVGQNIQMNLTDSPKPRPFTHDLISSLFDTLSIRLIQIAIWERHEAVFKARLFLSQELPDSTRHIIEIDTRPSDALTLALSHNAPLYCRKDILDNAIPYTE